MGAINYLTDTKTEVAEKTFVRDDGHAIIVCPACQKVRKISTSRFTQRKTKLNIKCSCSHRFTMALDYRQAWRKPTNLAGTCKIDMQEKLTRVKNISFDGICLEVNDTQAFHAGQRGVVNFTLDDKNRTKIRKEFQVMSVNGKTIGCQFQQDRAYEKELGFYLRF
ncbi:MAG: PilZ domain-containing protein [Desulfobulbaceae bacterium]|nr:MAG: PilZ domain-containing protein [Desulfobulbaceae bacterium]